MKRWQENIIGFIIGIFTLGFYWYVYVETHHDMNFQCGYKPIYKSTYKEFKDEFKSIEWHLLGDAKDSLFGDEHSMNYIHASIIKINGVCHNMTSYGLIMARMLIKKEIERLKCSI